VNAEREHHAACHFQRRHENRRVLIHITQQGQRAQRQAVRELDLANVEWFACWNDQQKLALLRLLGDLESYLKSRSVDSAH
jgi:DNA-binding MarR family transcriptional regulator